VTNARGTPPELLITDTACDDIRTEDVQEAIARGTRTRLLNPRWIDGQLAHPHHGGSEIADRFENVVGLGATTRRLPPWVVDELFSTYVANPDLAERFRENNPHAYADVLARLHESAQRGYWSPDDDALDTLRAAFLAVEGDLEDDA
jgi:cobaltochelatase CobN